MKITRSKSHVKIYIPVSRLSSRLEKVADAYHGVGFHGLAGEPSPKIARELERQMRREINEDGDTELMQLMDKLLLRAGHVVVTGQCDEVIDREFLY